MTLILAADAPAWTDRGAFWLALTAFVVSLGALVVSWWNAKSDNRSAAAAEDSAVSARQAADYARAAVASAHEGDHERYGPDMDTAGKFEWVRNPQRQASDYVYVFRLPRSYRMHADAINDNNSRTPTGIHPSNVIESGHEYRINLGGAGQPLPKAMELRFFPPMDTDAGNIFTCPCDRPPLPSGQDSRGHWTVTVPVARPPEALVTWA